MPTLVRPLDTGLAYIFCPQCRIQGTNASPLSRDSVGSIRCQFGHGPFTGAQLQQSGADMVKSEEVFTEQPTITDIRWPIFVNPAVKAKLEAKFSGRIMITLGTYLAALADDSIVMITGEDAKKLRELGVHNGKEMVSAMESMKDTERERSEAVGQIEKFMAIMKAAQIPGA